MSIARAVIEYILDQKKLGCKTLFATHYHELTVMEEQKKGVKNYNVAVKKRGDDITFLRKIIRGGADESYGIEVAKLAGVPNAVVKRAKEILSELDGEKQVQRQQMEKVKRDGRKCTDELCFSFQSCRNRKTETGRSEYADADRSTEYFV